MAATVTDDVTRSSNGITMDTAVALVQAYLHVNGYFTVTEYPVLEAGRAGQARTVTDLDVLAYRFAGAGEHVAGGRGHGPFALIRGPDPALGAPSHCPDMIVGEVKEGRAPLNPAMRDPAVLGVALARFGCCPLEDASELTGRLLTKGSATSPSGHSIRIVAFGDAASSTHHGSWATVTMRHVVEFLQTYLPQHWAVLRHAQFHDSALATLALLEKWKVTEPT